MGAGMALYAVSRRKRGWSRWAVTRHFLIRGGVLVALQLLVINRAWELSPGGWGINTYIGVLVALGGTMILGSLLLWLKPTYLLALSVALAIGTELLVPDPSQWGPGMNVFRLLLLVPGGITESGPLLPLWVNYPVLPWLELVVFGLAFGYWLAEDPRRAFKRGLALGGAFLAGFAVLRYLDGFGNIRPRMGNGWMDLLNPVKYPPSITFALLMVGIDLILLWLFARVAERWPRVLSPLAVLGRAPLFFYVLHPFLYAGIGHLLTPGGTSLLAMYPYWLLGVLILFPVTLWYGHFKRRQPTGSLLQFL
jgi:uncharacterized membrane protein